MKRKRTYVLTRKRRTLRRALLLPVLLALFTANYNFLPIQALREYEDNRLTGRTKITQIVRDLPPALTSGPRRFTLSENENAVIFCGQVFVPFAGWTADFGAAADCSADAPAAVAYSNIFDPETRESCAVFFGRVMDERVASVELRMEYYIAADNAFRQETIARLGGNRGGAPLCACVGGGLWDTDSSAGRIPQRVLVNCYDGAGELFWSGEADQRPVMTGFDLANLPPR